MAKKHKIKEKKVPLRTCIACKLKKNKFDMIRIVRDKDGQVFVDAKGKVRGRGANLCESIECFDFAVKKGLIEKSLLLQKSLTKEDYSHLRKDFSAVLYQREFRKGQKAVTFRVRKDELIDVLDK